MHSANKMAQTVAISDIVKVEVGVRFGRFVKIYRGEKSISLADKTWLFVVNNQKLITKSLESGSDYGLTFTQAKSLRVSMFREQPYVTFCEDFSAKDGKRLTKYVSLNKLEWNTLQNNIATIQKILNYDIIYCDASGNWHLPRAGQVLENATERRLVPRMCAKTFELQLRVYMITKLINETRKETCDGCNQMIDLPYYHRSDGFGCQADWYTSVQARLEDVQQMINLEEAISTVNRAMLWEMTANNFTFDNQLLRDVTVDHKTMPACDSCKELLPIYWDLFESTFQ